MWHGDLTFETLKNEIEISEDTKNLFENLYKGPNAYHLRFS
jgi:hypothetical protein